MNPIRVNDKYVDMTGQKYQTCLPIIFPSAAISNDEIQYMIPHMGSSFKLVNVKEDIMDAEPWIYDFLRKLDKNNGNWMALNVHAMQGYLIKIDDVYLGKFVNMNIVGDNIIYLNKDTYSFYNYDNIRLIQDILHRSIRFAENIDSTDNRDDSWSTIACRNAIKEMNDEMWALVNNYERQLTTDVFNGVERVFKDSKWVYQRGIYLFAGELNEAELVEPIEPVAYHPTEECDEELPKQIIESCFNSGKQVERTTRNLTCN